MIGYRPHPSLLGGSGGGSGGSGVDQTARDAVAAADAVNSAQATEIGALKAADTAFDARVAAGEIKDGTQDTAISGLQSADTALAGRATALEGRATSGETKDASQDADLVAHAGRLTAGETKDASQDADLTTLHGADTALAGRATALEGRATSGEAKDVSQDADLVAHGARLTSAESKNTTQDTELAGLHTADTALGTRATNLESRATAGESKDSAQDVEMGGLRSADAALRDRATALETKASANETKDAAQDKSLSDMDARITAVAAQGYDDAPIRQLVADEATARSNAVTGEAKTRGDADTALGNRVTALEGRTSGGGSIVRTYDHDIRQTGSVTAFDLVAAGGSDATHFRLRLYAGGASGTSPASGGTSNIFFGGEAGEMLETGWISLAEADHITSIIGMGGAGNRGFDSNKTGNNGGDPTTVDLLKGVNLVLPLTAAGGLAVEPPFHAFAAVLSRFTRGTPLPGQGSSATTPRGKYCNAQTGRNRPTSGGGSHMSGSAQDSQAASYTPGDGGTIIYDRIDDRHGLKVVPGGAGARSSTSLLAAGADGVNPQPTKTGTAGSGGGGSAGGPGGAGGFPGAGGGSTTNTGVLSGRGGNGCLDIEYGKKG